MGAAPRTGAGPRRLLGALLVGAVLLGQLLLGAANPARACACGGFVDPEDQTGESEVLQETAVLSLRDGADPALREMVGADLEGPTSGESTARHDVVTEFSLRGEPSSFTTDLTFAPDPDAEQVIPTYTTTEVVAVAGVPVGYVLVIAGVVSAASVLVALVAVVLAVRSRGRPRP